MIILVNDKNIVGIEMLDKSRNELINWKKKWKLKIVLIFFGKIVVYNYR